MIYKNIFAAFLFLVLPLSLQAATLGLRPISDSKVVSVGDLFRMGLYVNSGGVPVNNIEGSIIFPTDLLEVISISGNQVTFPLWIDGPTFSNPAGIISLNAGVPSPGFSGPDGLVLTAIFRVKKAGNASVFINDAHVRANDGQGSDILAPAPVPLRLSFTSGAKVSIPELPSKPVESLTKPAPPKLLPVISSPTHPDQKSWYNKKDLSLTWPVPESVDSVRTLIGHLPDSVPHVTYDPPIKNKDIANLDDGVWYFHLLFRNSNGWGDNAVFRIQIDTAPPRELVASATYDESQQRLNLQAFAKDLLSGVDHYEFIIDDDSPIRLSADDLSSGGYSLPYQVSGDHRVRVSALDRAGNITEVETSFVVPLLEPPQITVYPKRVKSGSNFTIKGKSQYPDIRIDITSTKSEQVPVVASVNTDSMGEFTWVGKLDHLGTWKLVAGVVGVQGGKSLVSEPVFIDIYENPIWQYGNKIIQVSSLLMPIIAIILVLILLVYYSWSHFYLRRLRFHNRIKEARAGIHKEFTEMKESLADHIDLLDKAKTERQLTKEEQIVVEELRRHISTLEQYASRQIDKIEKER